MFPISALGAALAAAPAASAAPAGDRPPALVAYEAAVAETTAAMRAAAPRFAACQKPSAAKLVLKADLARGAAVTTAALGPDGAAKVAAPCFEKVVQDVLVRAPPRVGTEAAVVLDLRAAGVALEGDVALLGPLAADAVEAGMRGVLDRVAQCYLVGLAEAPGLAGQLVVSFTVLPDGRAWAPELKRTELWNPTVEGCVLRQVATATFAPPQGGAIARVTYPFSFNPPS
jgi:hypothetical protein